MPKSTCSKVYNYTMYFLCHYFINIFDFLLKVLGPVLVCVAISLIGLIVYCFFTVLIYDIGDIFNKSFILIFLIVCIALLLLINILTNYFLGVFIFPGGPSDESKEYELTDENCHLESTNNQYVFYDKICSKCELPKPPRTHHCSICKRCIYKMDHHCPWLWNCVGFQNYRYFILFLFWLWIGCGFAFVSSLRLFIYQNLHFNILSHFNIPPPLVRDYSSLASLCCLLCGALLFAIGILLFFHLWLLFRNKTTLEFQVIKQGNVSYSSGFHDNFYSVFGVEFRQWRLWLFMGIYHSFHYKALPMNLLNYRRRDWVDGIV